MATVLETLDDYIRNEFGHEDTLDPDADLLELHILDSFNIVQIATFIQERFDIELEPDDLVRSNLSSLTRMVELIERKTAARPAP